MVERLEWLNFFRFGREKFEQRKQRWRRQAALETKRIRIV